jgi:hypothetical protein
MFCLGLIVLFVWILKPIIYSSICMKYLVYLLVLDLRFRNMREKIDRNMLIFSKFRNRREKIYRKYVVHHI